MLINLDSLHEVTNEKFYQLYKNTDRYLVLWGGAGSGKSYYAAEKILVRILVGEERGIQHKFLCLRKTQPAVRKSVFALFTEYLSKWGLNKYVKANLNQMTFTFPGGSQIICGGLDDPEKLKSIVGITGVWIEEATEINLEDFTQVDLRLRGQTPSYKQIIISFNPVSENSWVKARFFDAGVPINKSRRRFDATVGGKQISTFVTCHHSTYRDNRFIDSEYIAVLETLIHQDRNYYNVYNLGKWGVLKGLIYDNWEVVNQWPEKFDLHGYGLDFGYSVNPTALIEVGFIGDTLYEREHIYEKGLTNPMIASLIQGVVTGEFDIVCADSAEPKSIQELRNGGINVFPSFKGKDSVLHGIQRIKQYKTRIYSESVNLIKEKESYKWAEDKDGNTLNAPVKFRDHLMDAERYIVGKLKGVAKAGMSFLGDAGERVAKKQAEDEKQKGQGRYVGVEEESVSEQRTIEDMIDDDGVWT